MKIEVYWVVRHNSTNDAILFPVAGPFCDMFEAHKEVEKREENNFFRDVDYTVKTQEIEVF